MPENIPITLRVAVDADLAERVLVQFLRDYLSTSGHKGFVVGVSGGIDSAVSAALAARAVGAKNVYGIILPEDSTPKSVLDDAGLVLKHLGIPGETKSIQPLLDGFQKAMPKADRTMMGNAKARSRMILLHAEAAARHALVLGTGNKTEILTGYFSKFGDGGVDLQPLGDLYKTQVRQLAEHLGLPERIRTVAPTAGLWSGQTDEGELGITYEKLDRLLLGLELKLPYDLIAKAVGVPLATVQKFERLRGTTGHKRSMPLVPKLGLRTPGNDWRQPVLE